MGFYIITKLTALFFQSPRIQSVGLIDICGVFLE
jgi:hypothetical protein